MFRAMTPRLFVYLATAFSICSLHANKQPSFSDQAATSTAANQSEIEKVCDPKSLLCPSIYEMVQMSDEPLASYSYNFLVTVADSVSGSDSVDTVLRGGRHVSATLQNPKRTIDVKISGEDRNLVVGYSLTIRVATKNEDKSASFEDVKVAGNFSASLGQAVAVLEVGESKLSIRVDEVPLDVEK